MATKQNMDSLIFHIGKEVNVLYAQCGRLAVERGVLKRIFPYRGVQIEGHSIPFVGYGCAISAIKSERGESLFRNPLVKSSYRGTLEQVDKIKREIFGPEIASKHKEEDEKREKEWAEWKDKQDLEAKAREKEMVEQGHLYVKPDLVEEWEKLASMNSQGGYSGAIVRGVVEGLKALANGLGFQEVEKAVCNYAETGYMLGCASQALSYFSPRGEDWRVWWNKQYMSAEEAEKSTGVVNSAIFTIKI